MTILCQKEWQLVQEGKIHFPQRTEEILYPQPFLAEAVLEKQDWYFEFQPVSNWTLCYPVYLMINVAYLILREVKFTDFSKFAFKLFFACNHIPTNPINYVMIWIPYLKRVEYYSPESLSLKLWI